MLNHQIDEGGSIELAQEYLSAAAELKKRHSSLPFSVFNSSIKFDDYIVGELKIRDTSIQLLPRNKEAFTLNTYFQILCYLYDMDPMFEEGTGFSDGEQSLNIDQLSKNFCSVCGNLLQFGLTGTYYSFNEFSKSVTGDIDFNNFHAKKIPTQGVSIISSEFTLDTKKNQLIKSALNKLIEIENFSKNPNKFQILRELSSIKDVIFSKDEANELLLTHYSPNPWYIPAIDLSIKILFELELEYLNGNIEWMAFLQNSNTLFESYVRKILTNELINENISKWDKPKKFMTLKNAVSTGDKSFSPDILVNYDDAQEIADAVIDVKNKKFEPSLTSNLDKLTSTNDIYQLIFYCEQLNSSLGGLIYPSSTTNEPIELSLESKTIKRLFAFSINMNEKMAIRHKQLAKQVSDLLLKEI